MSVTPTGHGHPAGPGSARTVATMVAPRWRDGTGPSEPGSDRLEPFPQAPDRTVPVESWFGGATEERPDHRQYRDPVEEALPAPRQLLRAVAGSSKVRRWVLAALTALVVGVTTYVATRPAPPTRRDVIEALVEAGERSGRSIDQGQAECIVTELESENVSYDAVMSSAEPSPELRRVFDNAFLRCTTS